jgi:hypothetical protein
VDPADTIKLNFFPLREQSLRFVLWRRAVPESERLPPHVFRYSLPTAVGSDSWAKYAISFSQLNGFKQWRFTDSENRQLALRVMFHLLRTESLRKFAPTDFFVPLGFRKRVHFVLGRFPAGNQEVWLEPYFLDEVQQYGFLVDFHFHKKTGIRFSREVQRLSLSLDASYRSNRNYYIDRMDMIARFLRQFGKSLFPLSHSNLIGQVEVMPEMVSVPTQRLQPKSFVVCGDRGEVTVNSQWRGLDTHGPLQPVRGNPHFIMLYQASDRNSAVDLYRALAGQSLNVAFRGIEKVFHLNHATFSKVEVDQWTAQDLDKAIAQAATLAQADSQALPLVLMVEDRDRSDIYYAAKFELLRRAIPLQVVSKQLIQRKESLKWSVSNIALQIFAKLGGVPWKVVPSHNKCLIVGIGQAHKLGVQGIEKYFAYYVATDSSGLYKKVAVLGNSRTRADYLKELRASLIAELATVPPDTYSRCVLHVPYKLKLDEVGAIHEAVIYLGDKLSSRVEFVVIKINDDHKFFGYSSTNSLVPLEGTVARLSKERASYVVWFEGLSDTAGVIRKRVAAPLHIEFLWPREQIGDEERISFIQDVFNLSGTNWRGFNAKSTPISTYYCTLIARFVAEFPSELPLLKEATTPWFL